MRSLLVALALAWSLPASAQSLRTHDPAGWWRTVRTDHYRLHYPAQAEAWALVAASQLEPIRERVSEAVGYAPTQVVDVVVMDPLRMSNGFALPFTGAPRMGLFATPPGADPAFGHYRSWAEELIVHEDAHLVHLLRPSRNPTAALVSGLLGGSTPLTTNSPSWVVEGYATVIEGRLTGMGRPNSDFRALLLRKLAQEGRLPTYAQLDGSDRWLAGAFRYLVGSAYLEWLEARTHEGALVDLWARMTALRVRGFTEAFEGVFGDDPATLYGRFVAETTLSAMEMERELPADTDTLWLDLSRSTSAPAVSPDGEWIALVRRPKAGPPILAVYGTADDPERRAQWEEDIAAMLEADPEDVAPVPPKVFPRSSVRERVRNARPPGAPRWLPDSSALLFAAWGRNGDGFLRPDLYRWDPTTGLEKRITHGADILDADAHPDGTWAVGVRSAWGQQQLVRIDLATGKWREITEPDPIAVYDTPRVHPDGDRFLFLRHAQGWHLVVRTVDGGEETEVALPEGAAPSGPAWSGDGTAIFVSLGQDGFGEVWRVPLDGGAATQVTHSPGGAAYPAPTPDGTAVFYLSLDAEGLDVHRKVLAEALPDGGAATTGRPPAIPPEPPPPVAPPTPTEVTPGNYGAGRWEALAIAGLALAPKTWTVEIGARFGDVVGRHDLVVLGGAGAEEGWRGLSVAYAWRGWPVTLGVHAFGVAHGGEAALQRAGVALVADRTWWAGNTSFSATAGGLVDGPWGDDLDPRRGALFLGATTYPRYAWRNLVLRADVEARGRAGWTGGQTSWLAGESRVAGNAGVGMVSIGGEVAGGLTGAEAEVDRYRLGGTDTSMVPVVWLWSRVLVPAIPVTSETGQAWTTGHAYLDLAGLKVGIERHRLYPSCEGFGRCEDSRDAVLVSASFDLEVPPLGLARTAGLHGWGGLACALEDPRTGPSPKPCQRAEDWRGWLGLTWRP